MYIVKHWISRIAPAVAATVLVLNLSVAHAIQINATTTFDDAFSFGPTNGSFSLTSGGTLTTATYSGSTASANPLAGPLTDNFDGTGFDGTASANSDVFQIGFDTVVSVFNDEAVVKEVKFRLDYSNMVNADGPDAYADSSLELFDSLNVNPIFFSDLKSDTLFGDQNGVNLTGGFGDVLMESGAVIFTYLLNPSETVDLTMSWTLEGEDVSGLAGDLAEASLSANLTVVPLPGALLFMVSGMLLFPLQRLLRKK